MMKPSLTIKASHKLSTTTSPHLKDRMLSAQRWTMGRREDHGRIDPAKGTDFTGTVPVDTHNERQKTQDKDQPDAQQCTTMHNNAQQCTTMLKSWRFLGDPSQSQNPVNFGWGY